MRKRRGTSAHGQENKAHTVSLGPLLADVLAEAISWDSRLLRTLHALLTRPGFLTNEYNAGRLVPYLSPLKLFSTTSRPQPDGSVTKTNTTLLFEDALARRLLKAKQSKTGFIDALLNDIPKMMFFLLPGFAVWLKLLYWRTRRLYVEHVIFLLHVHAFGFLLLSPLLLFHPPWLTASALLLLSGYVIVALRTVYKQSWLKTLAKFLLLNLGYFVLFSVCSLGTTLVALWFL